MNVKQLNAQQMNRELAQRKLRRTAGFTFVGGRVRITNKELLALVAELGGAPRVQPEAQHETQPATTAQERLAALTAA